MPREDITFQSDGLKLVGHFYTPENVDPPYPTVVMGGGWCYVKELIQPEYAEHFVQQGIAALTFDYRNLGESEGKPRQHIRRGYNRINGSRPAFLIRSHVDCPGISQP